VKRPRGERETPAQDAVLAAMQGEPVTVGDLAAATGLRPHRVAVVLRALADRGLAARVGTIRTAGRPWATWGRS
jgi:predicted Rossmann fold nucleotide-binding protein DprA/Smf involved in DNA uptake